MATLAPSPSIRAEGLTWPLQTFLDTHGFENRPDVHECRSRYSGPVEIVDEALEIRREYDALTIDWHGVIAVKAGPKVCAGCGFSFEPLVDPIYETLLFFGPGREIVVRKCRVGAVNVHEVDYCEGCQDYGEWGY